MQTNNLLSIQYRAKRTPKLNMARGGEGRGGEGALSVELQARRIVSKSVVLFLYIAQASDKETRIDIHKNANELDTIAKLAIIVEFSDNL